MKTKFLSMLGAGLVLAAGTFASADTTVPSVVLLEDNFDAEASAGLNYVGFQNWDVVSGYVDLVGAGTAYDWLPGNGKYIDLDGSKNPGNVDHYSAGTLVSKNSFHLHEGEGVFYRLEFDLAGNQSNYGLLYANDEVTVTVGSFSETFTAVPGAGFVTIVREFSVAEFMSANITFDHAGGDSGGLVLDNVRLTQFGTFATPTPSAALAGMALLGGLGLTRTRRNRLA